MKERFTPPDKNLKRINGLLVLDCGTAHTAIGKRLAWYDLRCKCGAKFRVTRKVVTLAKRKAAELACDVCKHRARVDKQREYARKNAPQVKARLPKKRSVPPGVTHELVGGRPPITAEAVRILARHARKPYYRRAVAILTEYIDASVEARIVPNWNRGAVEAIEKAQEEYRTGKPADADRWTPQNRADGLQIVSYPVYQMPSP